MPVVKAPASSATEHDVLLMLLGLAQRIERANEDGACVAFMDLLGHIKGCDTGLKVRAQFVAQALLRNIDCALGLRDAGPVRHRGTINDPRLVSMTGRLPPMAPAATAAGTALACLMADHRDITLVELGAGSGPRVESLLRDLACRNALPRTLTVAGVTSSGCDLENAEADLKRLACRLNLPFRFLPLRWHVEDLPEEQWDLLRSAGANIFIRAAFSLHHIGCDLSGASRKDAVLRRLKSLNPEALVIAEPSSSFETEEIGHRLAHGWGFYGSCFTILDRMAIPSEDRALARMFYAQEMVDVLSLPPVYRFERFETSAQWLDRLRRAGFQPCIRNCPGSIGVSPGPWARPSLIRPFGAITSASSTRATRCRR